MKELYARVHSVIIKENYVILYLERPVGYTITSLSLYRLSSEGNQVIAPITNGNTINALRFIVPKNKDNFWVTKLKTVNTLKVMQVATSSDIKITKNDIIICQGVGIGHILSYLTDAPENIPQSLFIEMPTISDFIELPFLNEIMKHKLKLYVSDKIPQMQRDLIKKSKLNRQIIFGSLVKKMPVPVTQGRLILMLEHASTLLNLRRINLPHVYIPHTIL